MYFSVISPRPGYERQVVYSMLQDSYREHQWLWQLFPGAVGTPRDFLFQRADLNGAPRYYVVSARPPQPTTDAWHIQTKPYSPQLKIGDVLEFDLRANPVVTRKFGDKHARHDVIMDAKKRLLSDNSQAALQSDCHGLNQRALIDQTCSAWLVERGKRCGFEVSLEHLSIEGYTQHVVKNGKIKFSTVEFRGILKVTQALSFTQMLTQGLGHAKAFGCGLMLVRHVRA